MKSHIEINEVVMNSQNVHGYCKTPRQFNKTLYALPKVKLGFIKPIPTL